MFQQICRLFYVQTNHILVLDAEHFRHEHYLCEDSICRQEHFQVWSTEAELQQHRVKVHGDHMSRHEKRQAMRIPLDINVSSNLKCPICTGPYLMQTHVLALLEGCCTRLWLYTASDHILKVAPADVTMHASINAV